MAETSIPNRFHGPPGFVNGGYACAVCAAGRPGPLEVTLKKPMPVEVPLTVADGQVRRGEEVIADSTPVTLDLDVPAAVTFEEAVAASAHYPAFTGHIFPTCFVCGPERAEGDGLRLFPGPVGGRVAAPWVPHPSICEEGVVTEACVWAALDCPSYFGALAGGPLRKAVLGRLAVTIRAPIRQGERMVVMGWPLGSDGRKIGGAAAIFGEDGLWRAASKALWIELR